MRKWPGVGIILRMPTKNHDHMMYTSWDMECDRFFLSFLAIFCTFTLLTTWKIKILKKWEKHLQLSSFYTCLPKIRIIWCMLPEIWSVTDRFFIIFSHFLHFYATKIFKKWKKLLEILPLFTYVPQMKTIWCLVPEI